MRKSIPLFSLLYIVSVVMIVRYAIGKKEQENHILIVAVEWRNAALYACVIAGICLLLFVVFVVGWLVMRHHNMRLRLLLKEQEYERTNERLREQEEILHELITAFQELNEHNRTLLRQLSEKQARHHNIRDLDRVMESLQSNLLTRKEEESFRKVFSSLYPSALVRLRTVCPTMTRCEELFCMLVLLKQTNEELAHTLGISVSSVSKTRYRVRIKLGLPEGSDADAEVCRIMDGKA